MKTIFTLFKILVSVVRSIVCVVRSIVWGIIVVSGFYGFAMIIPTSASLLYAALNENLSFVQCLERLSGAIEICFADAPNFYTCMFMGMIYLICHPDSELVQLINAIEGAINDIVEETSADADGNSPNTHRS